MNAGMTVPILYTCGAFNTFNTDCTAAIVAAIEETGKIAYLQTSTSVVKREGVDRLYAFIEAEAMDRARKRIIVHLDHCTDENLIRQCIDGGWDSVMVDGSNLSLEANINLTRRMAKVAHASGVLIEGELGTIGGVEDDLSATNAQCVNVDEVVRFVDETGVDLLAIGIGNQHGLYQGIPELRFDLLAEVASLVEIPLVLHGGTGLTDDQFEQAIQFGVRKINISTELKMCFFQTIRRFINNTTEVEAGNLIEQLRSDLTDIISQRIQQFFEASR